MSGVTAHPSPSASPPPSPSPALTQKAGAHAGNLALGVRADAWIDVRQSDGTVLLSRLVHAGESLAIQGHPPLALVVGNAVQVQAQWDGQALNLLDHVSENGVARMTTP
jgi:cytoskeleton protein RodZ